MAMYAIAITPLIQRLEDHGVKQAWYADGATAGGALKQLKQWWDGIAELGPDYGYFPNATKTWLVVKEGRSQTAIPRDRSIHNSRWQKTPWSCNWHAAFCCRVCPTESCRVGWRSRMLVIYSRDSATRSICCIHPWPQAQMTYISSGPSRTSAFLFSH